MKITTVFHPGPKKKRVLSKDGSPYVTDEIYNSLISACGTFLGLVGSLYLVCQAYQSHPSHKIGHMLAFAVYGICTVNLFLSSALHHAVEGPDHIEEALLKWDYMAIYAMIAGAMTPFCIILLPDTTGPLMLVVMWTLACMGILLKAFWKNYSKKMEMGLYLLMGWLGGFVVFPASKEAGGNFLVCLLGAGVVYTAGSVIYYFQKPNLLPGRFGFHEIWHIFVLAGSAIHFYVLYRYLI